MIDPLTLDQLRILIAVAESGSFSAAARRLGRVQSAISQSVQSLEATLRVTLFDRTARPPLLTEAGHVLLDDARHLLRGAETLRARAETIAADVEPELTLAVDPVFPNPVLMASLRALRDAFPHLPVTLFTEGLGGAEQRLRDGTARLGIFPPLPNAAADLEMSFLTSIPAVPVVAADHALAGESAPLSREVLERYVQLVLTDRTPLSAGFSGNVISAQLWRFADQGSRLEYLLGGFGWCYMPRHLVDRHIAAGRLKLLDIAEQRGPGFSFAVHVVNLRGRPSGRAGQWLVRDLSHRLRPDAPTPT
ncbi:MAG TPA: LysR family transcriptional regulator [Acetobacteraceae bacterium]|nr:LysR family transcriptional regulator [Acetobacteraceae bacterium]